MIVDKLRSVCKEVNIDISEEQLEAFGLFYAMLIEWNKKVNLTAIVNEEDVIYKHFIDSILILKYVDLKEGERVIDVGTGAGFPGIPVKIMVPGINITMMDSVNKKLDFIRFAVEKLGLQNIDIVHSRSEDLAHNSNYREGFDYCLSRAVGNLSLLNELCLPFVRLNGQFIAYKSIDSENETADASFSLSELGGEINKIEKFHIPGADIDRAFIFIKKIKNTPGKYPRKAGTPKKHPLIIS